MKIIFGLAVVLSFVLALTTASETIATIWAVCGLINFYKWAEC